MSLSQKRKGTRVEREMVHRFEKAGLLARRVPLSGAADGLSGDVIVNSKRTGSLQCEVKARKGGAGFAVIERWLAGNDLLLLKRDGKDPLVVMEMDLLLVLLSEDEP